MQDSIEQVDVVDVQPDAAPLKQVEQESGRTTMSSPKRNSMAKASILQGKGRLNVKNPLSKKEQQKGPRKTSYKGKLFS